MAATRIAVALLTSAALAFLAVRLEAQAVPNPCADMSAQMERVSNAYIADANAQMQSAAMNALVVGSIKAGLVENPAAQAAANIKQAWNQFIVYIDRMKGFEAWLQRARACADAGGINCFKVNAGASEEEERQFTDSLTELGTKAASAKAGKAYDAVRKLTQGMADVMNTMPNCVNQAAQRAQAAAATREAVSSPPDGTPEVAEPTAKPVDPPDEGNGGGNAIIWGLVGAAGVAVGVSQLMPATEAGGTGRSCTRPSSNPLTVCSSQGGSSTACQNSLSEWGSYCRCTGSSGFNAQRGACQ